MGELDVFDPRKSWIQALQFTGTQAQASVWKSAQSTLLSPFPMKQLLKQ